MLKVTEPDFSRVPSGPRVLDVQLVVVVTFNPVGLDKLSEPRENKGNQVSHPQPISGN